MFTRKFMNFFDKYDLHNGLPKLQERLEMAFGLLGFKRAFGANKGKMLQEAFARMESDPHLFCFYPKSICMDGEILPIHSVCGSQKHLHMSK